MKTLKEKNEVLWSALMSIDRINGRFFRDAVRASEEEKYDRGKTAFDEVAKVVANVVRHDLFGDEPPKKDATPIDPSAPTLNQILMNPPLTGFAKFLSLPELGIQFRRHKSANMTKLIATWRDNANDHVYEISVQRDGDSPNCGWRALAMNDGYNVFQLRTKNRHNCEHFALSAMKRYLKCGHRKTYRTLAKKEGK